MYYSERKDWTPPTYTQQQIIELDRRELCAAVEAVIFGRQVFQRYRWPGNEPVGDGQLVYDVEHDPEDGRTRKWRPVHHYHRDEGRVFEIARRMFELTGRGWQISQQSASPRSGWYSIYLPGYEINDSVMIEDHRLARAACHAALLIELNLGEPFDHGISAVTDEETQDDERQSQEP